VIKSNLSSDTATLQFDQSADYAVDDGTTPKDPEFSSSIMSSNISRFFKVASPISPVRWGRHIFWSEVTTSISVTKLGDTAAVAMITRTVPGEFLLVIGVRDTTNGADSVIVDSTIHKPFKEQFVRNVLFAYVSGAKDVYHAWVPEAITAEEGNTVPDSANGNTSNAFDITSLRLSYFSSIPPYYYHDKDTITDPLSTWFRYARGIHSGVPVLFAGDTLRFDLTIQSESDSAELVYLRHGVDNTNLGGARVQMNLISSTGTAGNYTRVYQRTIIVHDPLLRSIARFSAVVDVFSHDSILDNAAPFSNEFWIFPYIIIR
jgi:hypothetical protein